MNWHLLSFFLYFLNPQNIYLHLFTLATAFIIFFSVEILLGYKYYVVSLASQKILSWLSILTLTTCIPCSTTPWAKNWALGDKVYLLFLSKPSQWMHIISPLCWYWKRYANYQDNLLMVLIFHILKSLYYFLYHLVNEWLHIWMLFFYFCCCKS